MTEDVRWQQRLSHFSRAINLLREVVADEPDIHALPAIVKEGIIQRFEYTLELAWKTLKDKMEYDGLVIEVASPRYVFKLANQQRYIGDIEDWITIMVNNRNLMSHNYDSARHA